MHCSEGFTDASSEDKLHRLLDVRGDILSVLRDNADALTRVRNARTVDVDQVLAFADNISLSLSAPRLWQPGHPLCGSLPPAPQLEDLRVGAMADYNKSLIEHANAILLATTTSGSSIDASITGPGTSLINTATTAAPVSAAAASTIAPASRETHTSIAANATTATAQAAPGMVGGVAVEAGVKPMVVVSSSSATTTTPVTAATATAAAAAPVVRRRVDINMGLDSDSD